MQIQGINQYGGFNSYKNINSIQKVSVDDVKKQDEELKKEESLKQSASESVAASQAERQEEMPKASKIADLENISLSFNTNETYSFIGQDASLENLDVMSAISDMQKDKVLQQYQYFVGDQTSGLASEDGIVIQK